MQRITVSLPDSDAEALRALAAESGTTMSETVRSLIPQAPAAAERSAPSATWEPVDPQGCGVFLPLSARETAVLQAAAASCGFRDAAAYASRIIADAVSTGLKPPAGRLKGVWGHESARTEAWVPLDPATLEALSERGREPTRSARALLSAAHTSHPFRADLRLSGPQKLCLESAAAASGCTKVAYLRQLIGQVRVRPVAVVADIDELKAARADLKRTGSSVNQIARLAHTGALVAPEDAEKTLRSYREACARIECAIGRFRNDN